MAGKDCLGDLLEPAPLRREFQWVSVPWDMVVPSRGVAWDRGEVGEEIGPLLGGERLEQGIPSRWFWGEAEVSARLSEFLLPSPVGANSQGRGSQRLGEVLEVGSAALAPAASTVGGSAGLKLGGRQESDGYIGHGERGRC